MTVLKDAAISLIASVFLCHLPVSFLKSHFSNEVPQYFVSLQPFYTVLFFLDMENMLSFLDSKSHKGWDSSCVCSLYSLVLYQELSVIFDMRQDSINVW